MSLTTDPNDPALKEGQKNETGQHSIYLVLSEEERAKGFVRPLRTAYVHVGRILNYKGIWYMLSEEQQKKYSDKKYVAVMISLVDEKTGKTIGGSYVTQKELDAWKKGERIGGCDTVTSMNLALSETYARNPKFYGATFCCTCNKHLPVDEFVWEGTDQTVGS
jgi:hypothetical protein